MIAATRTNHNNADLDYDTAARKEIPTDKQPPDKQPRGQPVEPERPAETDHGEDDEHKEHDEHERDWSEEDLRAYYQLDDPCIQAIAARGGVPDTELAVRLGRMLGFARHSRR